MKVLISEIPEEGFDLELEETIESDAFISPVNAWLKIQKIGDEVVVRGNLRTDVKLQCSRCLKGFRSVLSAPVDVVYHPVEELRGEDKHELKTEELDMGFYSEEELDLLDLLREQIILNLPMKSLCTDMCKGICLKCGTDLNAEGCSCIENEIDPRFEALKKLLDR